MKTISQVADKIAAEAAGAEAEVKTFPREQWASWLESKGFLRAVAGEHDFNAVIDALVKVREVHRGIFFTGGVGVGKSMLLKIIHDNIANRSCCAWLDCGRAEDVISAPSWEVGNMTLFLDDFGSERFRYGDEDIVGDVICKWHATHRPTRLLYITSNLAGEEIDRRYGGRVLDRISELCIICKLTGTSKRKAMVIG